MIVRLHNLMARPLSLMDAEAITELLIACETAEFGGTDITKEDIHKAWQAPGFDLKMDAWSIVTRKGQFVGYAEVRQGDTSEHFHSSVSVHPNYRNRGIGTLLIQLAEERARQLLCSTLSGRRVVVSSTVSSLNQVSHRLLEREGYMLARCFWRLTLDSDDQQRQLAIDLAVDAQSLFSAANLYKRTGMYVARRYEVYEKELSADKDCADQTVVSVAKEPLII